MDRPLPPCVSLASLLTLLSPEYLMNSQGCTDSWSLILSVPGAALTHETVRVIKSTALGQDLALEPLSVLL